MFQEPSEELRRRLTTAGDPSKGWRNNPHAKWYTAIDPEGEHEQLKQVYELIAAELQNASKKRLQYEDELKTLRGELSQH